MRHMTCIKWLQEVVHMQAPLVATLSASWTQACRPPFWPRYVMQWLQLQHVGQICQHVQTLNSASLFWLISFHVAICIS